MFTRILLASDGSDEALCAARSAAALARQFQATLIVVYVSTYPDAILSPDDSETGQPTSESDLDPIERAALEDAETAVQRTRKVLTADPTRLDFRVCEYIGEPADTILSVAEQEKADLIVLGCRGIGGIRHLLLGSVSEKVAREAHCSVLIVRQDKKDEREDKE